MRLINRIIPGEYRYPTITPFTIPDGHTYLKTLEILVWRMKQIIDEIDENNVEILDLVVDVLNSKIDEINDAFTEFEGEVDDKLASVDTKISDLETFVNAEISTLVTYVNDSVQQIINNSIEVQDPVVATLIGTDGSETRTELNAAFVPGVTVDAETYGNDSTNAVAHITAMASEAAARGVPLTIPAGRYRVNAKIDVPSNVAINFDAGAVLVVEPGAYDGAVLRAQGTEGARVALAENATAGSLEVAVPPSLAATLTAGDIIGFDSTAIQYSTNVRSRELHKVASVLGSTVTLDEPMRYSYNTSESARAWKIEPVRNVTIRNPHFYSDEPSLVTSARSVLISFGVNCHVINTTIKSGTGPITLSDCIDSTVDGVSVDRMPNLDNFEGYVVVVSGGSYNFQVSGIRGRYCRHAFTTLGKVYDGQTWGGPRNGTVSDSIIQIGDSPYSAFDTHPEGEDIDFINCHAYGGTNLTGNGFQVRAKRVRLVNCKAVGTGARGVRIDTNTAQGTVIEGGEYAYNELEGVGGGDYTVTGGAQIHHNTGPGCVTSKGSLFQGVAIFDNGNYGIHDAITDSSSNTVIDNYIPASATQTISVLSPKNNALIAFNAFQGYASGGDGVGGTVSPDTVRTRNYTDLNIETVDRVNVTAPDSPQQIAADISFGSTRVLRLRRGAASTTLTADLGGLTTQAINGTLQFTSGGMLRLDMTWDAPLRTANGYLWVASGGVLRVKTTVPESDTDGDVVGG